MVIRDGIDDIEVFMVVRHHQIDFASGALVFPGGKVDENDLNPELRKHGFLVMRLMIKSLAIVLQE